MSDVMLSLKEISRTFFGVHAVKDVSLDLERGQITGLIGENGAGKSTLMNLIGGVLKPDGGSMILEGQPYTPGRPADATTVGIAFIHQELNLFTNLTIAENIFINSFPKRNYGPISLIDRRRLNSVTVELLGKVNLDLAPDTPLDRISPGERQLVEIAKALHEDAKLIILDEPTTSLTTRETQNLFNLMHQLRQQGVTMIYISHILNDVLELSDSIAVMRDGELQAHEPKDAFTINRMISLMVGRSIEQLYPPHESIPHDEVALEVSGLSEPGIVKDINFQLRWGEVLGLFGLMGSGRTEMARILFGMDSFSTGEILIDGTSLRATSPAACIRNKLAFVTENRREEGLMMSLNVADNVSLVSLDDYASTPLGVLNFEEINSASRQMVDALRIKTGPIHQSTAKSLSGGNQQKVVIAKWLLTDPKVFIMDEPTRGIDVGAKYEIYSLIDQLASGGNSVVFISSELDELMAMSDRILVMSQGEIVGEFDRAGFDKENILRAAFRENGNNHTNDSQMPALDTSRAGANPDTKASEEGSITA